MKFLIIYVFTILFLFSQDNNENNLTKLINDINTTSQSPTHCRWEYSTQEEYHIFNYLCKQKDEKTRKDSHLLVNFSYKRIKAYKISRNSLEVKMTPYRRYGLKKDRKILIHHLLFIKNPQVEHYATGMQILDHPILLIDGDVIINIPESMLNLK